MRQLKNSIWDIQGDQNEIITENKALKGKSIKHFQNLYSQKDGTQLEIQVEVIKKFMRFFSEEENQVIERPITREEVKKVLSNFSKDKIKCYADKVLWKFNKNEAAVNAKLAYKLIMEEEIENSSSWWIKIPWLGKIPLNFFFIRLCFFGKILTWHSSQIGVFQGTGICFLCNREGESIDHLFGWCSFFQVVWKELPSSFNSMIGGINNTLKLIW